MKQRSGLTLLEVVVALALMGSIMVTSLLAFSKHRRQLQLAEKRIEATMIADGLVKELTAGRDGIPVSGRGIVAAKANWIWQTSPAGVTTMATVPMQVIRFEIFEVSQSSTRLVSVQVVKRMPWPETAMREETLGGLQPTSYMLARGR